MFLFSFSSLLEKFKEIWKESKYYVIAAAAVLLILILVIIICCVKASKNKKAKKAAALAQLEASKEEDALAPANTENVDASEVEEFTPTTMAQTLSALEEDEDEALEETEEVVEEEALEEAEDEVEEETLEETEEEALEETEEVVEEKTEEVVEEETLEETEEVVEEEPAQNEQSVEEKVTEEKPTKKAPAKKAAPKKESTSKKTSTAPKKTTKSEITEQPQEQKAAKGKYEIVPDANGFKYILKASNGQSLIASENYTTLVGCKNAIKRLKENAMDAEIKIEQDKKKNYQFHVIKGTRMIAHSANYSTKTSAINASQSFLKFVSSDTIELLDEVDAPEQNELVDLSDEDISTDTVGKILILKENDLLLYKLIANNGQVICMSPTYKTMTTIKSSIAKFQEAVYEGKFYINKDKNSNYQFKLYNKNNRLLMTGESFTSADKCRNNIASCYRFAKNAVVEDTTLAE